MAGSGFTVTPESLRSVSKSLTIASAKLDNIGSDAGGLKSSNLGHRKLEGELGGFVKDWARQASKLSDDLFEFANRLRTAADNYQQVEDTQRRLQGGS